MITTGKVYLGANQLPDNSLAGLLGNRAADVTQGTVIYVDPAGSDANNGLTTGAAVATLAYAVSIVPVGGVIALKRGGTWTTELDLTVDGVTVRPYGTGQAPIIDRGTDPTGAVFNDGFESETSAFTTNWNGKTEASSSTVTLETTNPMRGTQSLKYTHVATGSTTGGTAYVTKTLTSIADVYVSFKVKIEKLVNGTIYGSMKVLHLAPAFGYVYLQHDATLERGVQVRFQGQNGNFTDTTYYQQGQTLTIELHMRSGTGNAGVECWVNGNPLTGAALTSTNTNAATSMLIGNQLNNAGGLGSGTVLLFDDIKVSATAHGVGTRGAVGVTVQGDGCAVSGLDVRNCNEYLIKLRDCLRAHVHHNMLQHCNRSGIIANIGGGDHVIDYNDISMCGISSVAASGESNGIQFQSTTGGRSTTSHNDIHHCGITSADHGSYLEGGQNIVWGNRYWAISGYGTKLKVAAAGTWIIGNQYRHIKTGAVTVDYLTANSLASLVAHNSAYYAGPFTGGSSPYVAFWGSGYAKWRLLNNVSIGAGIGVQTDTNTDLTESDGNVFNNAVRFGVWKGANQATVADWRTASGMDAASLSDDPLFVYPDAADLRLQTKSTALGIAKRIDEINAPVSDPGFAGVT